MLYTFPCTIPIVVRKFEKRNGVPLLYTPSPCRTVSTVYYCSNLRDSPEECGVSQNLSNGPTYIPLGNLLSLLLILKLKLQP